MTTVKISEMSDRVVAVLARPRQRNAISAQMVDELHGVCALIERDPKPLIVMGEGDDFAAGADIEELHARTSSDALNGINRSLFDRIARLPLPTVAAVSGFALGGGAELAYACDLRISTTTAVFGNPEPNLGIIAAAGGTYRLAQLVGASVAKQVLLAGRRIDAQRAFDLGLVMELTAPGEHESAAHRVVDAFSRFSPAALRLTKAVGSNEVSPGLAADLAQALLFDSGDKKARMKAFIERKQA
ncbi:enoyl-CoA hydratase [Microbacterium sp. Leaf288]|uniref:enoyl-CoA hydratase/isomerase family protein n=1 Tax=Microbacterium sp. Leaf288 TaxID=1736323 RepID=UPI0006F1DBE6|nr:enoyl-CoA hydratase/isomerase family protein [Microbacterium sp. Leaf288]KQP69997.1 enoyl-CoA hydratase [Microbacterium sp. Leaf288]